MADKLLFELVSPERMVMSEDVDRVTVPGTEGVFGVMPRHSPVMSSLRPGIVEILNDGANKHVFVRGGFAQVTPEGLTVLAEHAIPVDELDAAQLDQQIKDLEEDVADAKTDEARQKAQQELEYLKVVKSAHGA